MVQFAKRKVHEMYLQKQKYACYKYAKNLIDKKIDNLTDKEAKILMNSFILYAMDQQGIPIDYDNLEVKYLDEINSKKRMKGALALFCEGTPNIIYISKKLKDIVMYSETYDKLIGVGLQSCCHEVVHLRQSLDLIDGNNHDWINFALALEKVKEISDPNFYGDNYWDLILENMARYKGIDLAVKFLKKNSHLCKKLHIKDLDEYGERALKRNNLAVNPEFKYNDYLQQLFNDSVEIVAKDPLLVRDYPILSYVYRSDGSLKGTSEILRRYILEARETKDIKGLQELIKTVYYYKPKDDIEHELFIIDLFASNDKKNSQFYSELVTCLYKENDKERRI